MSDVIDEPLLTYVWAHVHASVCAHRFYLLLVEMQQYEHLQRGHMKCPAAKLQFRSTEPRPLETPGLGVTQTIH